MGASDSLNILLVDDHTLLLESLARRLDAEPDIQVAGTARSGEEALRLAGDPQLVVDIILMDVDLPDMTGFSAAECLERLRPEARIIFLSAYWHDGYLQQALSMNVGGYLTKLESASRVVEAIRRVAAGERIFSDQVRRRFEMGAEAANGGTCSRTPLSTLTTRELEVLGHIANGSPRSQIAGAMSISTKTVSAHLSNIMRKLDIHDRVGLTRFAIREGLVKL